MLLNKGDAEVLQLPVSIRFSIHRPIEFPKKSWKNFTSWLLVAVIFFHSPVGQVTAPPSCLLSHHTQPIELLKSVTCSVYIYPQMKIFCYFQRLRHWTDGCGWKQEYSQKKRLISLFCSIHILLELSCIRGHYCTQPIKVDSFVPSGTNEQII